MEWVALVELTAGLILVIAFFAKLRDLAKFREAIRSYQLLPDVLTAPAAGIVLGGEGVLGVLLILGIALPVSLLASAALFVVFALAVTLAHARNPKSEVECGCLGNLAQLRMGRLSIVLNVAVAASCLAASLSRFALDGSVRFTVYARFDSAEASFVQPALAVILAFLYWLTIYAISVARLVDRSILEPPS